MPVTSDTKTVTYDRPALHPTIPTPVDMTLLASSGAIALNFVDGVLTILVKADADERAPVQNIHTLYRLEVTPEIDADGTMRCKVLCTPVHGNDADSAEPYPTLINVPHDQNADAWQSAAGRPRQDYAEGQDDLQLLFDGREF